MRDPRSAIVIPSRLAATRLPKKPLASLGDRPMVVCVEQQARKVRGATEVLVATDSTEIAEAVVSHGGRAVMTRDDHPSGSDRVAEAVADLDVEFVINVQGDEPFLDPRDVESLLEALGTSDDEMATLRTPIDDPADWSNANAVKVVCDDADRALYFSRAAIPFDRRQRGPAGVAFRHIGVYGYRKAALLRLAATPPHPLELCEGLEQLRALALGMRIAVRTATAPTRGIDTEEDLAWARARVDELGAAAFPREEDPE